MDGCSERKLALLVPRPYLVQMEEHIMEPYQPLEEWHGQSSEGNTIIVFDVPWKGGHLVTWLEG